MALPLERAVGAMLLLLLGLTINVRGGVLLVARVSDVIGPVTARFMVEAVDRGEREGANGLIFEIDTPGGLDTSMRQITKRILAARVPVIVYVAPAGARAASAGTFIVMSAHLAAMAPGTTIGAAHPVSLGESAQADATMEKKVTNDAAAYLRSIAEKRGRNGAWAESAVKESAAISETEALRQQVIELVSPSRAALIEGLDGRSVALGEGVVTLKTRDVPLVEITMTWRDRVLAAVSQPNIAYLLFMLGLLGLYFELANPGTVLPGVVGAICLISALFAFHALPVNYAGVLLLLLAVVLFVVDVKASTHGILTAGGLVAMFMGSVMLFNAQEPALRVSLQVIIPVVLVVGAFFILGAWLSLRSQFRGPQTGADALVGQEGESRTTVGPGGGSVFLAGTHWHAVASAEIPAGRRVRASKVNGMSLTVEEVR